MGDKSQLLAMSLAHRYRAAPVIAGTFVAFALLNLLAVWLRQALFKWVPQEMVLLAAAGLFLVFGYRSWQDANESEDDQPQEKTSKDAFISTFTLVFLSRVRR